MMRKGADGIPNPVQEGKRLFLTSFSKGNTEKRPQKRSDLTIKMLGLLPGCRRELKVRFYFSICKMLKKSS